MEQKRTHCEKRPSFTDPEKTERGKETTTAAFDISLSLCARCLLKRDTLCSANIAHVCERESVLRAPLFYSGPEDLLKYLSDVKRANCYEGCHANIGNASSGVGCLSLTKAQCGYLLAESMQR